MDTIGTQKISTFIGQNPKIVKATCTQIRSGTACPVSSYMELATKVAELQFMNREFMLLFRGQDADYRNKAGNTSLKASLMRPTKPGKLPSEATLLKRFQDLQIFEYKLVQAYDSAKFVGRQRLKRQQILRWAILQHYEVCPTPLLDITHSLRIAASFASINSSDTAFIFVIGVPNLSGAITASAEAGLQIVRLSSVCPPIALRPHIQEGYLVGEYPEMSGFTQQQKYKHFETDFGRRLVAKFEFNPGSFWKDEAFPKIPKEALYPDSNDPLQKLTEKIQNESI